MKKTVLDRWNADKRRNGSSSGGTSNGGGGGGGGDGDGGAAVAPASPGLPPAASPPPLQAPGPQPRADDEDADGGPDDVDDLREDKKPLLALVPRNRVIQKKIKILSQRYAHFRRTGEVSSCFYRAFLFSYLENLGHLQEKKAEVTRLMQHVATSKTSFCSLIWDKECFSNADAYFTSVMDEFNNLVNLAANGLSSDEQYKICLKAIWKPRIFSWLRLLAETDIRTRGEEYKSLYPENFDAIPYCCENVRPMEAQANVLAGRALTYALGIPLRVETVDRDLTGQTAEVKCLDFFPRSELGKGPYPAVLTKWSSITPPTPKQKGRCHLLSSDRTPLLTLLCVRYPRRWYILYR